MNDHPQTKQPALSRIKNGWAAHGNGWAVHASTPEQAIQKFLEAEQRHKEIDQLPLWHERFDAHYPIEADTNKSRALDI